MMNLEILHFMIINYNISITVKALGIYISASFVSLYDYMTIDCDPILVTQDSRIKHYTMREPLAFGVKEPGIIN